MQRTCPRTPREILRMNKLDRICPCGVVGPSVARTLGTISCCIDDHSFDPLFLTYSCCCCCCHFLYQYCVLALPCWFFVSLELVPRRLVSCPPIIFHLFPCEMILFSMKIKHSQNRFNMRRKHAWDFTNMKSPMSMYTHGHPSKNFLVVGLEDGYRTRLLWGIMIRILLRMEQK